MPDQIEYCDIDPNNPPQLPLDGCRFSEKNDENYYDGTLIAVITHNGVTKFCDEDIKFWRVCKIPVVKKQEPDYTVKRLWWYENHHGKRLTPQSWTEKEFLNKYSHCTKYYAPGPEVPPESEWKDVR